MSWLWLSLMLIGPFGVTSDKACEADVSAAVVEAAPFLPVSEGDIRGSFEPLIYRSPAARLRAQADEIEARDAAFKKLRDLAQCAMWKSGSDQIREQEGDGNVKIEVDGTPGRNRMVCVSSDGIFSAVDAGECPAVRR